MGTLLKDIPGLAQKVATAARIEGELRDLPFLGVDLEIAGVPVKQFTPRHWMYLDAANVPFMCAEEMEPVHVAQFLWVVSPSFRPGDKQRRDAFIEEIVDVSYENAQRAIGEYIEAAMMDRPDGATSSAPPITSYLAAIVDRIAEGGYTWTKDQILDTPFAELFQYMRQIRARLVPGAIFINRYSDRARREAVADHKRQQAREVAA